MKEILFKGKSQYDGEWVYGWYQPPIRNFGAALTIVADDGFFEDIRVQPDTIGQFTGLIDKNGKRIFEGDIIRRCRNAFDWEPKDTWEFEVGHVEYRDGGFVIPEMYTYNRCDDLRHIVGEITTSDGEYYSTDILEVIGNIHDNPELLKGATNVSSDD